MSTMRPCTVLLTAGGGAGVPGVIRCLRHNGERDIRVVVTDMGSDIASFYLADSSHIVPPGHALDYADVVLKIVRLEHVDIIFINNAAEMLSLARHRAEFEQEGVYLSLPALDTLELVNNKGSLYEVAHNLGLGVPRTLRVDRAEAFEKAVTELGYPKIPVCFKPEQGSGGRGFGILCQDANSWKTFFETKENTPYLSWDYLISALRKTDVFPPLLVMEYLPGEEYSIDCLVDQGQPKYIIPRVRNQVSLGSSVVGTVVHSNEAIVFAQRLVASLGLHGNINVQLKRAADGQLKLIEINPRLSGTVVLCYAAGVNLPYFGVKLGLGESLPDVEPRWGTKMLRHWSEVFVSPHGGHVEL